MLFFHDILGFAACCNFHASSPRFSLLMIANYPIFLWVIVKWFTCYKILANEAQPWPVVACIHVSCVKLIGTPRSVLGNSHISTHALLRFFRTTWPSLGDWSIISKAFFSLIVNLFYTGSCQGWWWQGWWPRCKHWFSFLVWSFQWSFILHQCVFLRMRRTMTRPALMLRMAMFPMMISTYVTVLHLLVFGQSIPFVLILIPCFGLTCRTSSRWWGGEDFISSPIYEVAFFLIKPVLCSLEEAEGHKFGWVNVAFCSVSFFPRELITLNKKRSFTHFLSCGNLGIARCYTVIGSLLLYLPDVLFDLYGVSNPFAYRNSEAGIC
jgi:hypothetical protein